jgi:pyruvate-formate lyase
MDRTGLLSAELHDVVGWDREGTATDVSMMLDSSETLELATDGRSYRLWEMLWRGTHEAARHQKQIAGCGEDTLVGHARDFATLLDASEPFIQDEELIVGGCLATLEAGSQLVLGHYDPHFPPDYEMLLRVGLSCIRDEARERAAQEADPERRDFLAGVAIAYAAACEYVAKYAHLAAEMATRETNPRRRDELGRIAAVCDELVDGPPTSFHAALQLVQFLRILGASGCIGRFDQWMVPFYERDVTEETITQQEAQELLECFWIKLNHFGTACEPPYYVIPWSWGWVAGDGDPQVLDAVAAVEGENLELLHRNDSLRNLTLGGQTPEGMDACNELTFMCLRAAARLMLPEPKVNVRFFPGSPPQLLRACCHVLAKGLNALAVYNDEVAVPALRRLGIPLEDARDYCNDGCQELIIGGKSFSRFIVYDALTAVRETVLSGAEGAYPTFPDVISGFKDHLRPFVPAEPRGNGAISFPFFAASIDGCLEKASPTGARYSIWGSILGEVANAADGLAAIEQFIYRERVLSWAELAAAMEANYEGYEPLRQMLRNRAPKYGNDVDAVDRLAKEIAEYYCDAVQGNGHNREGHGPKEAAGFMLFILQCKNLLPASPDGRRQGEPVATSLSPSPGMDKSGPTAALSSASKIDLTRAAYGSVFDLSINTSIVRNAEGFEKLVLLIDSFLARPSTATLQINLVDRETLLRARENPDAPQYRTLIVRVWGFSAAFVELSPALQDHVLSRTEHRIGS